MIVTFLKDVRELGFIETDFGSFVGKMRQNCQMERHAFTQTIPKFAQGCFDAGAQVLAQWAVLVTPHSL